MKIGAPKATTTSCPSKWLATSGMLPGRTPRKLGWRVGNGHRAGLGATSTGSDRFSASRTAPSHPVGVSMPGPATMTGFRAAASRSRSRLSASSETTGLPSITRDFRWPSALASASLSQSSSGNDRYTGPVGAAVASRIAFDSDCGASCGRVGSWLHFTSGSTSFGASTLVR